VFYKLVLRENIVGIDLSKIKVALLGIGNCASAFIQGLHYYNDCEKEEECIGLRHLFLGGLHPRDIQVVAAFDVEEGKVGKDLAKAIFTKPNNVPNLVEKVPLFNVIVDKGPVLDGVGASTRKIVNISKTLEVNVANRLKEADVEIVINLLPSGAVKASLWYAEEALKAGCAFINVTPVSIASINLWNTRFKKAGLPLVGDDLIDQVGATTLHKTLLKLLSLNGVRITKTYQLDVGGGAESLDTLERTRDIKRTVKTKSVKTALPYPASVVAGSTDYVDFLKNKRDSYFWIKGLYYCKVPMQIDLKLSTVDAPNSGSALFDVVRAVKLAINRKLKGVIMPVSVYAFKNPPQTVSFEKAEKIFAEFVSKNSN
jgi:myo-inositol-1-phosphate synthase